MKRMVCCVLATAVGLSVGLARAQSGEVVAQRASHRAPHSAPQTSAGPGWRWAAQGYRLYEQGRFDAAAQAARQAVGAEPQNSEYRSLLIHSLQAANHADAALVAVREAIAQFGAQAPWVSIEATLVSQEAAAMADSVYPALQRNDLAAASANAAHAVRLAPNNPAYRALQIDVLVRQGEWAQVEVAATAALDLSPANGTALIWRGVAQSAQGKHAQALADLDSAMAAPTLSEVQQRWLRLLAADLALRANDPARAQAWLAHPVLANGGDGEWAAALASRKAQVEGVQGALARRSLVATPGSTGPFVSPVTRCDTSPQGRVCFVLPGSPPADLGHAQATEGYRWLQAGDWAQAELAARRATGLSPDNTAYVLLLLDALERGGQTDAALFAANEALLRQPHNPALQLRQVRLAGKVNPPAVREGLSRLMAGGQPAELPDPELAYLALQAGDDGMAHSAFQRAAQAGQLNGQSHGDAAFTALRLKLDGLALASFAKGVDALNTANAATTTQPASDQAAEQVLMYRQAAAEVSRTWGLNASLTLSRDLTFPAESGLGGSVASRSTVAGLEWYGRPLGYRNGQRLEVFARAYATLSSSVSGPTGWGNGVASAGVRWQPYPASPVVLAIWRQMPLGAIGEADWVTQAAYFQGWGTDVRAAKSAWWSTQLSGEWTHSLRQGDTYASLEGRLGRAWKWQPEESAWAVWPFASFKAEHNTQAAAVNTQGIDVGISLKRAFRQDAYTAPMSTVDIEWRHRAKQWGGGQAGGTIKLTTSY